MKYDELDVHVSCVPDVQNDLSEMMKDAIMQSGLRQPQSVPSLELHSREYLEGYKRSIGVDTPTLYNTWRSWASTEPERGGSKYPERVRFWASRKANMPACPFIWEGLTVLPILFHGDYMVAMSVTQRTYGDIFTIHIHDAIPVFDRYLDRMLATSPNNYNDYRGNLSVLMRTMTHWDQARKMVNKKLRKKLVVEQETTVTATQAFNATVTVNKARNDLKASGVSDHAVDAIISTLNLEEKETMSKSKTVAANMIDANKQAGKDIAFLTAGRVANKTIKSAMTPILALMLKPTFMQRAFMKLTGAQDPVEKFMESPVSDLLAAEGFKLALEMKGVKDERLQETANKAIVYAGLQLADKIPLEELMDEAIGKVAEAVNKSAALDKLVSGDK